MLDSRIYRAGLVPVVFALIVGAFSLQDRPRGIGTTLAPDAFSETAAMATLQSLAQAAPTRRPGDAGDGELASVVAGQLRAIGGYRVSRAEFDGETADGRRRLTTVIARQAGQPGSGLVVVAHRDARARGSRAELSATAALLELARVVANGRLRRTVTFASISGGSAGAAGARDLPHRLSGSTDAVLVLGSMAGATVRRPFVTGWSSGGGQAPLQLRHTVEAALRAEAIPNPGALRARAQWARLALPLTIGEQGPLGAAGLPAVLLSAAGERPPAARDAVTKERMQAFGRSALRSLTALDNGPDVRGGITRGLVTMRKVLPLWAVRLIVGALLVAPVAVAVDAIARARRRGESVLPWVGWIAALATVGVSAAAFAWLLGVSGLLSATPPEPVAAGAIAPGGAGRAALVAIGLVAVLAALVLRPALARAAGAAGAPAGPGAGVALVGVWCAVAVALWLRNPYAAATLVPGAHGLLLVAEPGVRLRRPLALALVGLAALPVALVPLAVAGQLGIGPLELIWAGVLWAAGGIVGGFAWAAWSLVAACLVTAALLALRAPSPLPAAADADITVRGPAGYAGPGSLGGTESALRR